MSSLRRALLLCGLLAFTCPTFAMAAESFDEEIPLTIVASGDLYNKVGPHIVVYVDEKIVGNTYLWAVHGKNQWQTLHYRLKKEPSKVEVAFLNDEAGTVNGKYEDRNMYVQSLSIKGVSYNPAQAIYDCGSTNWTDTTWRLPGGGVMYWSGKLIFNIAAVNSGDSAALAQCVDASGNGHVNGSAYTLQVSQSSGSIAATKAQCTYGGTQATLTTVSQYYTCTNGIQSAVGASTSTTTDTGNPVCNPAPVNGTCGAANGVAVAASPTTGFCNSGTATSVTGTGPWSWSCTGSNNGTTATCAAPLLPKPCLDSNGVSHVSGSTYTLQLAQTNGTIAATTAQCPNSGTQATVTTITQTYLCTNGTATPQGNSVSTTTNNGNPSCVAAPINGTCGLASGSAATVAPTTGLCSAGKASAVTGTGPWVWTCNSPNGGSSSTCQTQQGSMVLKVGNYTTLASTTEVAQLCTINTDGTWPAYPAEWTWAPASIVNQPAAATSGTPRVEEYHRDATSNNPNSTYYTDPDTNIRYRLVAVMGYLGSGDSACDWYTPFNQRYQAAGQTWDGDIVEALANAVPEYQLPDCGPFGYGHKQQSTSSGDLFLVYPAVYSGQSQQPHIAPAFGVYTDPINGYGAVANAAAAWSAQYGALEASEESTFETVPPEPTYTALNNLTIKGLVVNNQRPVIMASGASDYLSGGAIYIGCCAANPYMVNNLTIENIDLVSDNAPPGSMRAAIYINGASNLTLRNMRITGFESAQANGIFSSMHTAGTFTIDGVELYHDGGVPDNYAHHTYFGHSAWDANFTVHMINSWSHDSFAGHLMKSRAQNTILEGNYFQGTLPQNTTSPAGLSYNVSEDYNVDVPNGGTLVARNNIFVKTLDDGGSGWGNRIMLAYAMEGIKTDDRRVNSVDIENNTFVGLNAYWKSQSGYAYSLVPMNFSYPPIVPDASNGLVGMATTDAQGDQGQVTIPASSVTVKRNMFAGICGSQLKPGYAWGPDPVADYRGDLSVTEALSEMHSDYSTLNILTTIDTPSIVGTPKYGHAAQRGLLRTKPTVGAED